MSVFAELIVQFLGSAFFLLLFCLPQPPLFFDLSTFSACQCYLLLSLPFQSLDMNALLHLIAGVDKEGLVDACGQVVNELESQFLGSGVFVLVIRVNAIDELKYGWKHLSRIHVVSILLLFISFVFDLTLKEREGHLEEEKDVGYSIFGLGHI